VVTKENMMKMVPNYLKQVLLIVALLACFSAHARELFWKYNYQTNYLMDGSVRTALFDKPITNVRGNGPPSVLPNRLVGHISYDTSRWVTTGICYIDGVQFGFQLDNTSGSQHITWRWSDDSTLTVKRTSFRACSAHDDQYQYLKYGEYFEEGVIIDGTGRFEGASGTTSTQGDYRELWSNEDAFNTIGKTKITVNLD
jgi:hypothetical protein